MGPLPLELRAEAVCEAGEQAATAGQDDVAQQDLTHVGVAGG